MLSLLLCVEFGAEGMPQLEIKIDPENGQILQSATPLRVSPLSYLPL